MKSALYSIEIGIFQTQIERAVDVFRIPAFLVFHIIINNWKIRIVKS